MLSFNGSLFLKLGEDFLSTNNNDTYFTLLQTYTIFEPAGRPVAL